jgi:hypothetical protein
MLACHLPKSCMRGGRTGCIDTFACHCYLQQDYTCQGQLAAERDEDVLRADNLVSCVVIPNELRLELRV